MNTEELSNEFDVLVDAYHIPSEYGKPEIGNEFNEYEKSVYLTKAQDELVKRLYDGRNGFAKAFETSEELRRALQNLVDTRTLPIYKYYYVSDKKNDYYGKYVWEDVDTGYIVEDKMFRDMNNIPSSMSAINITDNSYYVIYDSDVWFITYETAEICNTDMCFNGTRLNIVPTTQDELYKTQRNPFRGANQKRALRLDREGMIEIISEYPIKNYTYRFVRKPKPVVLMDMYDGLSINGCSDRTECEIHESFHRELLDIAVSLAMQHRLPRANNAQQQQQQQGQQQTQQQ